MVTLWPHQVECLAAIRRAWLMGPRTLAVLATGTGKTAIALALLDEETRSGARALIIAHRQELIYQPIERAKEHFPELAARMGIVMAGRNDADAQVVVATVQTLSANGRLDRVLETGPVEYVVADEAHHVTSATWLSLLARLGNPRVLGLTATPIRTDGDGLSRVFSSVAYRFPINAAIDRGILVPFRALGFTLPITLAGIAEGEDGWAVEPLGDLLRAPNVLEVVYETWRERAEDRQTFAFTASVLQAHDTAAYFRERGVSAAAVDGGTPDDERAVTLAAFKAGDIRVLANAQVYTEGVDVPEASCALMICPTKSDLAYCLDLQTEVLTPAGWGNYADVKIGDMVAAFDLETEEIRWTAILDKIVRPLYSHECMAMLVSPRLDWRVTNTHRMLMQDPRADNPVWTLMNADDLARRRSAYLVPVAGVEKALGVPLSADELFFVGFWMADGTRGIRNRQVSLGQSAHQTEHIAYLEALLERLGISYRKSVHSGGTSFRETSPRLRYTLHRGLRGHGAPRDNTLNRLDPYMEKDLSPLLEPMTPEQLGCLLEGLHMGDGTKFRNQLWIRRSYHIINANLKMMEQLQSLCVRRGFAANLSGCVNVGGNMLYRLHIKQRTRSHVGGATNRDRPTMKLEAQGSGLNETVWCVTNAMGTLVTRRCGKVVITGNCQKLGRILRITPAKRNALVLDFAPLDDRNVIMAGDVLGQPRAVKKATARAERSGIMVAWDINGLGLVSSVDPNELVVKVLNYLRRSKLAWALDGVLATAGLSETMMLALLAPDVVRMARAEEVRESWAERERALYELVSAYRLYAVRKEDRYWQGRAVGVYSTCDEAMAAAEDIASRAAEPILAARRTAWRSSNVSSPQILYMRRLGIDVPDGCTKGQAAQLISQALCRRAVEGVRQEQEQATWQSKS